MITLKDYQTRVLDSLREFFRQCSKDRRPDAAFQAVLVMNGSREPVPYLPVSGAGLDRDMPYVCIRVPTGGGKTLLACHAAGLAMTELLHADKAVVLWLVPSNTILDQTAEALRDPRHPYRRALETACGSVEVLTIEEALRLPRAVVDGQTVVIVATMQSFRVEDTTGRKVYSQAGALAEHFLNLPADRLAGLQMGPDGKPIPSLVNILRLRRPITIADEAHNFRTDLSFETLGNVNPSCIIEFTATPARSKHPSNVLHRVSAAELKAADMVKLPLRVVARHPSQRDQLLSEAITLRADLERLAGSEAQKTGEYLRPILLIQAEKVEACEPLRQRLVSEMGIAQEQIKISVGTLDELKDVADIKSPKCPVRVIVTVQKLKEGWDCPFAYVLASLKETRSATAIEQIVGRILRLPGAQAKQHADLNHSYAFSVSPSIAEVLAELREALENNGFTTAEAEQIILPASNGQLLLGVHPETVKLNPSEIDKKAAQTQAEALSGKVRIDAAKGEITVVVPLDNEEKEKLKTCVTTPEAKARIENAVKVVIDKDLAFGGTGQTRAPSPYEQQLEFKVPRLCVSEDGVAPEFDSTFLLEHPWKLSAKDASLPANYNPLQRPAGRAGIVDVSTTGKIETNILAADLPASDFVATLHQQVMSLDGQDDWTLERLIAWLDWRIDHKDILAGEMAEFLRKVLRGLMAKFGITDVGVLALDRFRLRDEIVRRIDAHRDEERKVAFRQLLLPGSVLALVEDQVVDFRTMSYEPSWVYEGSHRFSKHYFGPKPGELLEKTPKGHLTEEFLCAQFIDGLPQVKFWVRNLARKTTSFRLQTSTDWFYPDFVCQLDDGRILVVEYKGKVYAEGVDAEEKRAVGAVWAGRSSRKCIFVMPTDNKFEAITEAFRAS